MKQPNIISQLASQTGMGRPGGMASRGSKPISGSTGQSFAAMENALLKTKKPDPKKLAKGGTGRQFFTKAAGGDVSGAAKTPGTFSASPTALRALPGNTRRFPKG